MCLFPRCKYSVGTVQYLSRLEHFSKFRVNVSLFFRKVLYDLTLDQHCRCFQDQGEGAADLLESLGRSQELEVVEFFGCSKIPAAAWKQLRGAKWSRLKKTNFAACLARERNGYRIYCTS